MRNITIIIMGLVVVGIVGWIMVTNEVAEAPMVSPEANSSLRESATGLSITTMDRIDYYPEAYGYYAEPVEPGEYPGIVMIHENRGLRPEIKQAADELAKEGYRVLAVDLYKGVVLETQEEARAYSSQFDQAEGYREYAGGGPVSQSSWSRKAGVTGWCFGGRQSLELAMSGTPLDATVVYYGGGMATSTERLTPISWPVLGIFGDQDQVIPLTMVNDFRSSLDTLGIESEVYVYEGVGHAFANPSNPNYAPESTAEAWARTLTFLKNHLGN